MITRVFLIRYLHVCVITLKETDCSSLFHLTNADAISDLMRDKSLEKRNTLNTRHGEMQIERRR